MLQSCLGCTSCRDSGWMNHLRQMGTNFSDNTTRDEPSCIFSILSPNPGFESLNFEALTSPHWSSSSPTLMPTFKCGLPFSHAHILPISSSAGGGCDPQMAGVKVNWRRGSTRTSTDTPHPVRGWEGDPTSPGAQPWEMPGRDALLPLTVWGLDRVKSQAGDGPEAVCPLRRANCPPGGHRTAL